MADPTPAPAPADTPATPAPVADPTPAPVTPPAAVDPAPVSTALDAPAAPAAIPATWPEDWREKLAAGDEKTLGMLQRLTDPGALVKKVREQERLISQGAHRKAPDATATPEALAAYRAEMGIPDKPEGYYEKLTEGLVIGDEDKPLVDLFVNAMHAENAPPSVVSKAIEAYYQIQEQDQEQYIQEQTRVKEQTVDQLRSEWGNEYRANMNGINNALDGFFGEAAPLIKEAVLPDGTPLMNHIGALKGFASLARELNPAASVLPAGTGNASQTLDAEIAKIESDMSKPGGYQSHMRDAAKQARYGQLLEAREKMTARGQR